MKCPRCSAQVKENNKFCGNCGMLLTEDMDLRTNLDETGEPSIQVEHLVYESESSTLLPPTEQTKAEQVGQSVDEVQLTVEDGHKSDVDVEPQGTETAITTERDTTLIPDTSAVSLESNNGINERIIRFASVPTFLYIALSMVVIFLTCIYAWKG
ncbi:zinc ribbon domain-containing protein [Paenibacillus jiagnxiensis]|uniref:zinc ribbon domain-containing protein n=1 Tax=Paenibacillus jiagnxiensis TaxID=3228926 RepID=UPI0033BFAF19